MDELLIRDKINSLAQVLYCAETSGPATLGHLQRWFQEIAQWAGAKARPEVGLLALAVTRVLDKMILDRLFLTLNDATKGSDDLSREDCGGRPGESNRYSQEDLVDLLTFELEELEAREESLCPPVPSASGLNPGAVPAVA